MEHKQQHETDLINEMKNKKILHWNYRGIKNLPIELKNCGGNIEELYLKENKLSLIPKWIWQLDNLTNLYLSGNKLKDLPDEIGIMRHLRVLDLSANQMINLPGAIKNLKAIRELVLDDNYLNQLPIEFGNFEELEYLSLCGNNFTSLPECLGSLNKLRRLLVDNNSLEALPNRLTMAPSLEVVSVSSNRLKHLPLNSFMSPTTIYFDCNPNLNYLSYPLLCQFMELGWDDWKICLSNNLNILETRPNQCIRLCITLPSDNSYTTAIVKLPKQLMRVFNAGEKEPPSLWELSLRHLFKNNYKNYLDTSIYPKHTLFYNLLLNGPTSICLNPYCQQPIFTEAWIIIGKSDEVSLLIALLFCSEKCTQTFDFISHGIEVLPWHYQSI